MAMQRALHSLASFGGFLLIYDIFLYRKQQCVLYLMCRFEMLFQS